MKISNFISKELVFLNTESESVGELINNILDRAAEVDEEVRNNLDKAKKAVLKRENETSTALGHGLVIPHGRIDSYNDTTVIAGTLKKPIKAIVRNREENIELFFIILSGLTKSRTVLKLMSLVSYLGRQNEFTEKIKDVKNEDEFIELMKDYLLLKK